MNPSTCAKSACLLHSTNAVLVHMAEADLHTGLEEGLSSMARGEKAVVSCPAEYARGSSLLPDPPDQPDRVEFELHLLNLTQVSLPRIIMSSDLAMCG